MNASVKCLPSWSVWMMLVLLTTPVLAQSDNVTYSRLFWQDHSKQALQWGDLQLQNATAEGEWQLAAKSIAGFPELDSARQTLVQMVLIDQHLLAGIRDDAKGDFQSGWVALWTGCGEIDHGDHSHWHLEADPVVVHQRLDQQQGNPAHMYDYGKVAVIANDQKNGLTLVDPKQLGKQKSASNTLGQFIEAGGQHITAAVVPGKVCYASWADREGEHKGQIDVVGLGENQGKRYSIQLEHGGIHGAAYHSGKMFFAPAQGINWVPVDMTASQAPTSEQIHWVSLGDDAEGKPRRTGAFESIDRWLLCTTGRGKTPPELCVLDATVDQPSVQRLAIPVAGEASVTTPFCFRNYDNNHYAAIFEEYADSEKSDRLHVIQLPSSTGGKLQVVKSIDVGRNHIVGHSGHHQATQISRRHLAFCNPGDGTISVLSTENWETQATLQVGGNPTALVGRNL